MTAITTWGSHVSGYAAGRTMHLTAHGARFVARWLFARRPGAASPSTADRGASRARSRAAEPRSARLTTLRSAAALVVGLAAGAGTVASMRVSLTRQSEIAGLVRAHLPAAREQLLGLAVGTGLSLASLAVEWVRVTAAHRIRSRLSPIAPAAVATALGVALPVVATVALSDRVVRGVLWRRVLDALAVANDSDTPGIRRPTTALRSAGPGSLVRWRDLGMHGRAFVATGPGAAAISSATGAAAVEPIRVFAGVRSARTRRGTVRAVVRELRRTGAFDRGTLLLASTTGTGWLSHWSVASVEHLTGGDCATAAAQYSLLPSGLSAVVQPTAAEGTARLLLHAVEAELAALPPERRPRLLVTGESLGAAAVLGIDDGIDDLLRRIDGGVLAGTPRVARGWEALVTRRDAGSTELAPVIDGGAHVRFATHPRELDASASGHPFGPWRAPRFAMLQHGSDPIVWWSPQLASRRPDWLREPRGRDVTPSIEWIPLVTFWQLATDMPASVNTPGGVAHRYFEEYVATWARVLDVPLEADVRARIEASIRASLPTR